MVCLGDDVTYISVKRGNFVGLQFPSPVGFKFLYDTLMDKDVFVRFDAHSLKAIDVFAN